MELKKLSHRVWYSMYEEERDRPCLGYIRGDHWSLAVDAGHSDVHVEEFYAALKAEQLPLPALTVLTHWHWDHSFGLHRIQGLSVANAATNRHLRDYAAFIEREGTAPFLTLDPSIQKEYAGNRPVVIIPADIEFQDNLLLDAGGITIRLFQSVSPHTDDTTLIYVPEEKVLFLGDCISGVFPTWEKDPAKAKELAKTIKGVDAQWCIGGHWPVMTKEELLRDLDE